MIIKDKTKRRKAPFIIIGVLLLLFISRSVFYFATEKISDIIFPVRQKIYKSGTSVKDLIKSVVEYKEILNENKILKAENAKVEMLAEFNKNLTDENIRLKNLLEMKSNIGFKFRVAKVNFRSPSNLYEKFFIDLGEEDGIKKDMIVFVDKNIIGKVQEVYKDYASVDMVTGENYNISAITESGMLGVVKGSEREDGTLFFEPNTFKNSIKQGEKIYTSGISEIYPKGLYIGEVLEVNEDESEIFRSIKVKSDIDMKDINEVLIMVPEDKK